MNGDRIDQYTVIRLLGKGGMSEVYLVEDNLGRRYALKVLSARLTGDYSFRERFKTEARIMASLNHPNIVGLHSYFEEQGNYCLAMDYLEGGSLKDLIRRTGPLPESQALEIFWQIAQALAHAHSQGIIHRDVKPSNILISGSGSYKLGDFGIARMKESEGLTRTGSRMGTLIYMSPEQIKDSKHVDAKTDVYSLGVTFYEMLTGRPPYDEATDSDYNIMDKIVQHDLPDPRAVHSNISKTVIDLLKLATCRDPDQRPQIDELLSVTASVPTPELPGTIDPHHDEPPHSQPETMIPPASPKKKKSAITGWVWGLMIVSALVTITIIRDGYPFVSKTENMEVPDDKPVILTDTVKVVYDSNKKENQKTEISSFYVYSSLPPNVVEDVFPTWCLGNHEVGVIHKLVNDDWIDEELIVPIKIVIKKISGHYELQSEEKKYRVLATFWFDDGIYGYYIIKASYNQSIHTIFIEPHNAHWSAFNLIEGDSWEPPGGYCMVLSHDAETEKELGYAPPSR